MEGASISTTTYTSSISTITTTPKDKHDQTTVTSQADISKQTCCCTTTLTTPFTTQQQLYQQPEQKHCCYKFSREQQPQDNANCFRASITQRKISKEQGLITVEKQKSAPYNPNLFCNINLNCHIVPDTGAGQPEEFSNCCYYYFIAVTRSSLASTTNTCTSLLKQEDNQLFNKKYLNRLLYPLLLLQLQFNSSLFYFDNNYQLLTQEWANNKYFVERKTAAVEPTTSFPPNLKLSGFKKFSKSLQLLLILTLIIGCFPLIKLILPVGGRKSEKETVKQVSSLSKDSLLSGCSNKREQHKRQRTQINNTRVLSPTTRNTARIPQETPGLSLVTSEPLQISTINLNILTLLRGLQHC